MRNLASLLPTPFSNVFGLPKKNVLRCVSKMVEKNRALSELFDLVPHEEVQPIRPNGGYQYVYVYTDPRKKGRIKER
jgi:hypothetical protein